MCPQMRESRHAKMYCIDSCFMGILGLQAKVSMESENLKNAFVIINSLKREFQCSSMIFFLYIKRALHLLDPKQTSSMYALYFCNV